MTQAPPATIDDVIAAARVLSDARAELGTVVTELNQGIEQLKADAMPQLRPCIDAATDAWKRLQALIEGNPGLFVKPRKVSFHGIKFGLEKGKGKLVIKDPAKTIKLIKARLPNLAGVLIATEEKPAAKAIAALTAGELKSIAVEITGADDFVVIRPEDGAIDGLVKALVKAGIEDDEVTTE